jgi:hypothetical protein
MQMLGHCVKAGHHKALDSSNTHANNTANTMQGDVLQEYTFHQCALILINQVFIGLQDKLSTTGLAAMVLIAIITMTIFLEWVGYTGWTCLSDVHSCRLTSLVSIADADLEPTIPWSGWAKHYMYNTTIPAGCRWYSHDRRPCPARR